MSEGSPGTLHIGRGGKKSLLDFSVPPLAFGSTLEPILSSVAGYGIGCGKMMIDELMLFDGGVIVE